MKTTSSEHIVYINCFECQNKNRKAIYVHNMFWDCSFHVCTELVNQWTILSYCGLVDPRISASDKDLPVLKLWPFRFLTGACQTVNHNTEVWLLPSTNAQYCDWLNHLFSTLVLASIAFLYEVYNTIFRTCIPLFPIINLFNDLFSLYSRP